MNSGFEGQQHRHGVPGGGGQLPPNRTEVFSAAGDEPQNAVGGLMDENIKQAHAEDQDQGLPPHPHPLPAHNACLPHACLPPPPPICGGWLSALLLLLLTLFAIPFFPPSPHHPHPRVQWHHRDITSQSGSNFFTLVGLVPPLASFSHNHSWESPHSGLVLFFSPGSKEPIHSASNGPPVGFTPHPILSLIWGEVAVWGTGPWATTAPAVRNLLRRCGQVGPPPPCGCIAIPWCRSVKVSVVDQLGCPPPFTPWHATTINKLNKRNNSHGGAFHTYKWAPLGSTFNLHKGLPLRYNLERGFFGSPSGKIF